MDLLEFVVDSGEGESTSFRVTQLADAPPKAVQTFLSLIAEEGVRWPISRVIPDEFVEISSEISDFVRSEVSTRKHDEAGIISVSRKSVVVTLGKCPALDKTHTPIGNILSDISVLAEFSVLATDDLDRPLSSCFLSVRSAPPSLVTAPAEGGSELRLRLAALKLRANAAKLTLRQAASAASSAASARPRGGAAVGKRAKPEAISGGSFADAEFRRSLAALQREQPQTEAEKKTFLADLVSKKPRRF